MEKNYFLVQLVGEYFIRSGTDNMLRSFDVELKLPQWQHCLSMAKFHVLPKLIAEKDPHFKDIRRCVVAQVKTKDGKDVMGLPFTMQNKEQLREYVESQGISLNVDMYPDLPGLRKRVEFAKHNPDKFKKQEQGKQKTYESISEALSLNANVLDEVEKTAPDIEASVPVLTDTTAKAPHQEPLPTAAQEDTTSPTQSSVSKARADVEGQENEDFNPHGEESEDMFD